MTKIIGDSSEQKNSRRLALAFGAIFLTMLALNMLYPFMSDDYQFSFVWRGEYGSIYNMSPEYPLRRVENMADIADSLRSMYFTWGGRMIGWGLVYLFVRLPHIVFDLLNATVFMIFLTLLTMIGTRTYRRQNLKPGSLVASFLLLWGASLMFANAYLWLCGSCVYLWSAVAQLCFLFFYSRAFWQNCKNFPAPILMFALGLLAGCSNENSGAVTILLAACFVYVSLGDAKPSKGQICGIVGAIIGYVLLMTAPGNFAKLAETVAHPETLQDLDRQYARVKLAMLFCLPLLTVFLRLPHLRAGNDTKKAQTVARMFLIGGILNGAAMLPLPNFPARSLTMTVVFWVIGAMVIISSDAEFFKKRIIRLSLGLYFAFSFLSLVAYTSAMYWYYCPQDALRDEAAAKSAEKALILPPYEAPPWAVLAVNIKGYRADMGTISPRPLAWPNLVYAKYWHLKSVVRENNFAGE